jgi:hypothetical protein
VSRTIGTAGRSTTGPEGGNSEFVGPTGASAECRALVRVPHQAEAAVRSIPYGRPAAAFLAHLIATVQGTPQTRARRRAEPADACAAYSAAMAIRIDCEREAREVMGF